MKHHQQKAYYTLAELTENLGKELDISIKGNPDCVIKGVCTIQNGQPEFITFLTNPLYKKYLEATKAVAVILAPDLADACPITAIITSNPQYVYARIAAFFNAKSIVKPGIHVSAVIGENCEIASSASIGANCIIEQGVKVAPNVVIGPGCVIGEFSEINEDTCIDANVTLYHSVQIGKRCQISSGVIIGGDGFGLANHRGVWHKIPQLGRVIIGDDVEIGAATTIDRGAIEDTVIENGVKLDNLIQLGHNVRIGQNTVIAACVGISGSTTIGKNCIIGGRSAFAGHITIDDNIVINGGSAITKSIREPGVYTSGIGGVVTNAEWRKNSARVLRLDQLIQRVKNLELALEELMENKVT